VSECERECVCEISRIGLRMRSSVVYEVCVVWHVVYGVV
jgi:hypothetical protein